MARGAGGRPRRPARRAPLPSTAGRGAILPPYWNRHRGLDRHWPDLTDRPCWDGGPQAFWISGLHLVGLHTPVAGRRFNSINGVLWDHRPGDPVLRCLPAARETAQRRRPRGLALLIVAVAGLWRGGPWPFPTPAPGGSWARNSCWPPSGSGTSARSWPTSTSAMAAGFPRQRPRPLALERPHRRLRGPVRLGLGNPVIAQVHVTYWVPALRRAGRGDRLPDGGAGARAPKGPLDGPRPGVPTRFYLLHPAVLGLVVMAARADGWPAWLSAGAANQSGPAPPPPCCPTGSSSGPFIARSSTSLDPARGGGPNNRAQVGRQAGSARRQPLGRALSSDLTATRRR